MHEVWIIDQITQWFASLLFPPAHQLFLSASFIWIGRMFGMYFVLLLV
jgi:hypothetical protein